MQRKSSKLIPWLLVLVMVCTMFFKMPTTANTYGNTTEDTESVDSGEAETEGAATETPLIQESEPYVEPRTEPYVEPQTGQGDANITPDETNIIVPAGEQAAISAPETPTVACPAFGAEQRFDDMTVSIIVPEGALPEGVEYTIKEVTLSPSTEQVLDDVTGAEKILEGYRAFDITFTYQGQEIQPAIPLEVRFVLDESNDLQDAEILEVFHLEDENAREAKRVEAVIENNRIVISADSFSIYAVAGSNIGQSTTNRYRVIAGETVKLTSTLSITTGSWTITPTLNTLVASGNTAKVTIPASTAAGTQYTVTYIYGTNANQRESFYITVIESLQDSGAINATLRHVDIEIDNAKFTMVSIVQDRNGVEISRTSEEINASVTNVDRVTVYLTDGTTRECTLFAHYGASQNEFRGVNPGVATNPALDNYGLDRNSTSWGGSCMSPFNLNQVRYVEVVADLKNINSSETYQNVTIKVSSQEVINGYYRCPGINTNLSGVDIEMIGEDANYIGYITLSANPIITKKFVGIPAAEIPADFRIEFTKAGASAPAAVLTLNDPPNRIVQFGTYSVLITFSKDDTNTYYQWGLVGYIDGDYTVTEYNWTNAAIGAKYIYITDEVRANDDPFSSGNTKVITVKALEEGKPADIQQVDFRNSYTTPAVWTPAATKTAAARNITAEQFTGMTAGQFTFTLYESDADGTEGNVIGTATNSDGGMSSLVTFAPLTYNEVMGSGEYHYYLLKETSANGNGWLIDTTAYLIRVAVINQGSGVWTTAAEYWNGEAWAAYRAEDVLFENTYAPGSVDAHFEAAKAITGPYPLEMKAGLFSFAVKDGGGNVVAEATNGADGKIVFPDLTFTATGMYNYTIVETSADGSGFSTDKTVYNATVTVTDSGTGQLAARVSYQAGSAPTFTNRYSTNSTEANFEAVKKITGPYPLEMKADQFSFAVKNSVGTVVATATNDAAGKIEFPKMTFTATGTYNYTIVETSSGGSGFGTDATVYEASVIVSDAGNGQLAARVSYHAGSIPVFTNRYNPNSTEAHFEASKTISGKYPLQMTPGQFQFAVKDGANDTVAVAQNDAEGKIVFPNITFTATGTYHYTIVETSLGGNGFGMDNNVYNATVTVTDTGNGQLAARVSYQAGSAPIFTNPYNPGSAEVILEAVKKITGPYPLDMAAGQFNFAVKNSVGTTIDTATNDEAGKVEFPKMTFTDAGTYHYTIVETSLGGNGFGTDSKVCHVTVTVSDEGNGQLDAEVSYDTDGIPVFENPYNPGSVEVILEAAKKITGRYPFDMTPGQFKFAVKDSDDTLIEEVTNDASGKIEFQAMTFTEAGIYNYTIEETSPGGDGFGTDPTVYHATVTVTDDGNGQLVAEVSYDVDGIPVFDNPYEPASTEVNLEAVKTITGLYPLEMKADQFTFAVKDDTDTVVVQAANDANGNISFPSLTFTETGIYHYTIVETSTDGSGFTIDTTVYNVTVTVTDEGLGQLAAEVSYEDADGIPAFENLYVPDSVEVQLEAAKEITGPYPFEMAAGQFTFGLKDDTDALVEEVTNDAGGTIRFTPLVFTETGIYNYTIVETSPDGNGFISDTAVYNVTVTVTDEGLGQLAAEVSYETENGEPPTFVNTFAPEIEVQVFKNTISVTSAAYQNDDENINNVNDEDFRYDIDFMSASNVDLESFTVEDAIAPEVRLQSLWTPVVWGDKDGLFDLSYQTNASGGWILWGTFPTDTWTLLNVADLGLGSDYITALQFKYGAVEVGFSSRNVDLNHRIAPAAPLKVQPLTAMITSLGANPLSEVLPLRDPGPTTVYPASYLVKAAQTMSSGSIIAGVTVEGTLGALRSTNGTSVSTQVITPVAEQELPPPKKAITEQGSAPNQPEITNRTTRTIEPGEVPLASRPKTGDGSSNIWLYIALLTGSAVLCIGVLTVRRKNKKGKKKIKTMSRLLSVLLMLIFLMPLTTLAAPGDMTLEYRYMEGETVDIPATITWLNRGYRLVGQTDPVLEGSLPVTRTYNFRVDGALTSEELAAVASIPNLTLIQRQEELQRAVEKEITLTGLNNNDVAELSASSAPETIPSDAGTGTLFRSGVEFTVAARDGRGLPNGYDARVIYRGVETYMGDVYYLAQSTYQTTVQEDTRDQYVVAATYRPMAPQVAITPVTELVTGTAVTPVAGTGPLAGTEAGTTATIPSATPQVTNPTVNVPDQNVPLASGTEEQKPKNENTEIKDENVPLVSGTDPGSPRNAVPMMIIGFVAVCIIGLVIFYFDRRKKKMDE